MNWLKRQVITTWRIWVAGFHNFFRNAWLTTAATAIMVVTLTIILSGLVINMALNDTIDDIAKDVAISVYLNDNADSEKRDVLEASLKANQYVDEVTFISKEEALEIFQERNEDDPEVLKGLSVTENVLPASFDVTLLDLSQIESVVAIAEQENFNDIVDETSVNEERKKSIDRIAGAQDFITMASIVAGGVFAFISVLIIFNTIRMAIYTRSYEIEIMKLIGATPSYIRGPFLFEATLYGIIAGILSFVIVYSTVLALGPRVQQHLKVEETINFFDTNWSVVLVATVGLGALIGFLSSGFAMFKYLRLKKW